MDTNDGINDPSEIQNTLSETQTEKNIPPEISSKVENATDNAQTSSPLLVNKNGIHAPYPTETDTINDKETKAKCKAIIRNLVILALTWFSVFTAYSTLEILQSSLNANLGVLAITLVYIFKVISSLMGPYIIVKVTPKWTMVAGYICHTIFLLANFHATWFTLLPASVLLGMAMGPIWICFGVYVTVLGIQYSDLTGKSKSGVLSKFNGFMAMSLPFSFIIGLNLSSFIFKYVSFEDKPVLNNTTTVSPVMFNYSNIENYEMNNTMINSGLLSNSSVIINFTTMATQTDDVNEVCGPHYCPAGGFLKKQDGVSNRPETKVVYLLVSLLGIFNLAGLFLALFGLQNIPEKDVKSGIKVADNICAQVILYIKAFFDWRFLILTPAITYIFFFLTMMNAMFPKAYITCSIGIEMVGYISMTRGFTGVAVTSCSGLLGQYIHRNFHFLFSLILVIVTVTTWLLWDYWPNELALLFITAIVAGACNAINLTQFSAFLGHAFTDRKTEAFSFFHFWSGIVTAAAFFCNNYVCTRHQFYSLFAIIALTVVTFGYLSYHLRQVKAKQKPIVIETDVQAKEEGIVLAGLRDREDLFPNQGRKGTLPGNLATNTELCASQLSLTTC